MKNKKLVENWRLSPQSPPQIDFDFDCDFDFWLWNSLINGLIFFHIIMQISYITIFTEARYHNVDGKWIRRHSWSGDVAIVKWQLVKMKWQWIMIAVTRTIMTAIAMNIIILTIADK